MRDDDDVGSTRLQRKEEEEIGHGFARFPQRVAIVTILYVVIATTNTIKEAD